MVEQRGRPLPEDEPDHAHGVRGPNIAASRVRVRSGPLQGLEGVVVDGRRGSRLLIVLPTSSKAYLELDAECVEAVE